MSEDQTDLEVIEGGSEADKAEAEMVGEEEMAEQFRQAMMGGGGPPNKVEQNIRVALPQHPDAESGPGPTISVSIVQRGRNVEVNAGVDSRGRQLNAHEYENVCRLLGELT